MDEHKAHSRRMMEALQWVAPGSPLREGIDNVLRANTGGLIVLGYDESMQALVDGGFYIDTVFTPSYLYELAKMDGAIILNREGTKIIYANAHLNPDASLVSTETGMRHRTAERVAKQTGALVIAISQRRNVITLYQGNFRYAVKGIEVILTKANQAINTLEKYKIVHDQAMANLAALEFEELVTINDLLQVLNRVAMVLRVKNELLIYLSELGTEGRLIQLQMNELLSDIEEEALHVLRDYSPEGALKPYEQLGKLQNLVHQEFLEEHVLLRLLGYQATTHSEEIVHPRGYRVLMRIPRLPIMIIENVVDHFGTFPSIYKASVAELDEVEGVGEARARKIIEGIRQVREQTFADRHL